MNRDDITRLAFEAGVFVDPQGAKWSVPLSDKLGENILAFGALVAAAEREACAKVCEERQVFPWAENKCAAAIRARGEK